MQITSKTLSPTKVLLTVDVDSALLGSVKTEVLTHLAKDHVKIQGFRAGKAPLGLVEKSVDQNLLQSEFLDSALNRAYGAALDQEKLKPVAQPEVKLTKFVPFSTMEFTAEVEVVGKVKLPDYTKIKLQKRPVSVTAKDIDDVIDNLKARVAEKKEVDRPAKNGDEVVIDFAGNDAGSGDPISGADGKAYPLLLGGNSFIPGFETNLVGMKPGQDKTFTLTFPKAYGVAALQNRKVTFVVTVQKVLELAQPKLDAAFAAQIGPFKSMEELRADIKRQVSSERQAESVREFQNELIDKISDKTQVDIPGSLIESEIDRMAAEERQNLVYRGQTWEEHLEVEGVSDAEHRERQRDMAEKRVKGGLMLAEVADKEGISVSDKEVEDRLTQLRAQYPDQQMQSEIDKAETRREIASRVVSEKTIARLAEYATK